MRLDVLDTRILGLLQEDARLSFREIAQRVGSTTPTVSARVKALHDTGIIRGYRADLDHAALGGPSYVVEVVVHPRDAVGAHAAVAALPGAHAAHLLAGGRIVAHVHARAGTLHELHAALAAIPGLQTYTAHEVIGTHERAHSGSLPEEVEVPCHQCKGPIRGDPVKATLGDRTHVFCCRHCLATFRERHEATQAAAKLPRRAGKGAG